MSQLSESHAFQIGIKFPLHQTKEKRKVIIYLALLAVMPDSTCAVTVFFTERKRIKEQLSAWPFGKYFLLKEKDSKNNHCMAIRLSKVIR